MYAFAAMIALAAAPAAPADDKPDAKSELTKWQGTWEVELQLADGKEKPPSITKIVIKGDTWTVYFKGSDEPVVGKVKIVLGGTVKGLDVTVDKAVVKAAYLIDGDRAVLAAGDVDGTRPKGFSTSTGVGTGGILIYKRVKK